MMMVLKVILVLTFPKCYNVASMLLGLPAISLYIIHQDLTQVVVISVEDYLGIDHMPNQESG